MVADKGVPVLDGNIAGINVNALALLMDKPLQHGVTESLLKVKIRLASMHHRAHFV